MKEKQKREFIDERYELLLKHRNELLRSIKSIIFDIEDFKNSDLPLYDKMLLLVDRVHSFERTVSMMQERWNQAGMPLPERK